LPRGLVLGVAMRWWLIAGALLLGGPLLAPAAHARAPQLGVSDDLAFSDPRAEERGLALSTARGAGARWVRLTLDWSLVAPGGPTKPPGFDADAPGDGDYHWGYIEDAVRDARHRGLRVILVVVHAPPWAEGPGRPASASAGSWSPDPAELAAFVRAAARRFSGFYPDPKSPGDGLTTPGARLPAVRYWQIWDEPNGGSSLLPVDGAVEHYRRMLNASARTLRRVNDENVVVAAGTASTGPIAPGTFWRQLLCLSPSLRRASCAEPARLHVAAHHPVTGSRSPFARPLSGELGLRQLGGLRRMLDRATRLGTVHTRRPLPLWLTRLDWPTPPIDPNGVSPEVQARYLAAGLHLADRARVSLVVWRGLQDRVTYLPGNFPSIASALYFNYENDLRRDVPKLARFAYRFPFVVERSRGGSVAWGMAPRPGRRVTIKHRTRRGWRVIGRARADRSREFRVRLRVTGGSFRAIQGGTRSLIWR
jgi:hypothetical protein